jgi:uncharacterized protein (DUF58 family)
VSAIETLSWSPARILRVVARSGRSIGTRFTQATSVINTASDAVRRPLAPVLRALAPSVRIVSGFGWALIGFTGAAWGIGLAMGWVELTVIATVTTVTFFSAVLFIFGRSAYKIDLDLANTRIVVGQRAVGRIEVRNASTRSLLPARVELPVGSAVASFRLPVLSPDGVHEDLFTIPTNRRAVLTIGPVRSVRDDPFGLLRRQVIWTEPAPLYVHPRTVNLDGSSSGFLRDLEGLPTKDLSPSDVSFHALREYVPGDDHRNIHWKTTARTGTIMIRQFEETRRSHLALALSTSLSDYLDPEEFELAVAACGSLGLQALREEKQLSVLVHGATLHGGTSRRLLDELSGVEREERRQNIVNLAISAAREVPDASVVVLIFGGQVTAAEMRQSANKLPLGASVIALVCQPGALLSRKAIGDLVVLTIGSIDTLPLAMRRVAN